METIDKINVLFVFVQMKMGGSERLVCDLVRRLDRNLFTPHVAWLYEETPLTEFLDLGVKLHYVPKKMRFDLSTMIKIGRIIKENCIHVVNAHHFLPMVYSFYGAKIANNSKIVFTEHSEWEVEKITGKWLFVGRKMLHRSDAVIGISHKVASCIQKKFLLQEGAVETITNGVDCDVFSDLSNKKYLKSKYGFDDRDIILGIVANLKKNKNHIFLLKSFKKLLSYHSRLKLMIVGEGFKDDPENSKQEICEYIAKNNMSRHILLMGGRTDVPDLLKIMDVFCLVSHKEGLPISMIEAMASGLPLIGTDIEGIRDVIDHQYNGLLVPVNNEDELTKGLRALISNEPLRHQMGKKSRMLAEKKFSLKNCVEKYQQVFMSGRDRIRTGVHCANTEHQEAARE